MALSAALYSNFSATSWSSSLRKSKLSSPRLNGEHIRFLALTKTPNRKVHSLWIIRSALDDTKSSINDNGSTEPARILLERLFAQTQRLEGQMGRDSNFSRDDSLGLNLGILGTDLLAALQALKKKEEDLEDAERKVLSENSELNHAKEELERREKEIEAACSKQQKLEVELKRANLKLVAQAKEIEDIKLRLEERENDISSVNSELSLKEDEMGQMETELMKKSEKLSIAESELKSKTQVLIETKEIVTKQENELEELRKVIEEREQKLEDSLTLRQVEEEKLKVSEANLQKQTMEWLVVQQELKKLVERASMHSEEADGTFKDLRRLKMLLVDVRSQLVSSQKSLAFSRQKMKDQEQQLENQLVELEELKKSVISYMTSLKNAHEEVETERVKLRVAEARNRDLEGYLFMEKELVEELHEKLNKERSSLQQTINEKSFLQEELERKSTEFEETQNLLQVKESELVEAKLEIQNLMSEKASLQLMLDERDLELINAKKNLDELNHEITELRMLMSSKENQLIQASTMLKEKEEHVQTMQHELNDTKLKFSEAETVVERIVDLTNKMVVSVKDEDYDENLFAETEHKLFADDFKWQKRELETELGFARESLREKEMVVLAAQSALMLKDDELKLVLGRLDEREKELKEIKEEMTQDSDDLRKLYALAQERIGEKSVGDLAVEKLQLEVAQLEVEAATSALHKLTEMSRELLTKASLSFEADSDTSVGWLESVCFSEVKSEVARLSDLTDLIVKEAGIVS